MKQLFFVCALFAMLACEKAPLIETSVYTCSLSFEDESSNHPLDPEFQAALDEVVPFTPGIQVAIRTEDGKTWTGAKGMADIPNNVPLQACHKLMIGSISKIFTAVLILQLQDEGQLNIEDPLNNWLEESLIGEIENANAVTLKQLLDHTSGIRDYLSTEQFINAINTPFFLETQEEKLQYVYGKKAYHDPGEKFTYSNTNYVLLGLVVEKVRQMPLWDAVEEYIAKPLDLKTAEMGTPEQPIPDGAARPYLSTRGNKYQDILHYAVSDGATGDGGIASNTQDINTFIEALFNGQLLSTATFQLMTESLVEVGADQADFPQWPEEAYGLGISLFKTPYGNAYGHTGSTSSYNAFLFYFPEKQVTLSIAYNGASYADEPTEKRIEMRKKLFELILQ